MKRNGTAHNYSGRVIDVAGRAGRKGIPGVAVTDGRSIVATDSDGYFELLPNDELEFVYLSVPAGYRIPHDGQRRARFYRRADEEFTFELEPAPHSRQPFQFQFVHITDIHLGRGGWDKYEQAVIPEINRLAPAFAVVTGDIAFQEGVIHSYLDLTSQFDMPLFHAIGNHEMMMHRLDPKKDYKDLFGPTYYSFNYGMYHFIVLDGCLAAPHRQGFREVIGHVNEVQLKWLEQDVSLLPPHTPVILFIHIPIVSAFSERKGLKEKEPAWEIVNRQQLVDLLAKHNVKFVFQGHMHDNEHLYEQNVHYIESASISGSWWNGDNVDGAPQGYRIVAIAGEDAQQRYQPLGLPIQGNQMRIERIGLNYSADRAQLAVSVNVFDGDRRHSRVYLQIGAAERLELLPDEPDKHPHMWRGTISIDGFPDGEYTLEVTLEQLAMMDVERCSIFIKKPERGR